jgi:RNA-binding motif X-linked protein 2
MGRTLRVDHVSNYKAPKKDEKEEIDEDVEEAKRKALSLQYEAVDGKKIEMKKKKKKKRKKKKKKKREKRKRGNRGK